MARAVGVMTSTRADYGILRPVLHAIDRHGSLQLRLYATGTHLSPAFGLTVREIEADGWTIAESFEALVSSATPQGIARTSALTMMGLSQVFSRQPPDMFLVLGDRYETHAAVAAAVPFNIPIGHIHGGELSFGSFDDSYRHAISKMAHLHFPATDEYARRLRQLGEEPWRITVSGAPALDTALNADLPDAATIEEAFEVSLAEPPLLVTYHPVTRETGPVEERIATLLSALEEVDLPVIFTGSNADPGGSTISAAFRQYASSKPRCRFVESFGSRYYLGLLPLVRAMVGNSSSGLIEAPSFKVPVVNVGPRQDGRVRAANVIDCPHEKDEIVRAVRKAISPQFRAGLESCVNPYGSGKASAIIAEALAAVELGQELLSKRFVDIRSA